MEEHSSFLDDKHEFCFVVIQSKHVGTRPNYDIAHTGLHRV